MTLTELGYDYLEQSQLLRTQIANYRPMLKEAKGYQRQELQRKIRIYYEMSLDCRRIGETLLNYYGV